ncbi:helix-turn-helix transcriptional regulator [Nostoc sp. FACHB-110]|uniref:helix-turn-helix domain-containing protein n=1 Tax=Nostoc sp. FACHB-110 TaxID=2692834 RepID=UPI0016895F96|nr:helix-turn-helix transcriptional regulator [Nostoc sp. FACHB-110]MBD2437393.1 helix-turn-helix transcriptional regulator [Nostoc sp. FACHB-110]
MDAAAKGRLTTLISDLQGQRSLRNFARDLGVSLKTVQNWLEGDNLPSTRNLQKIAIAANMNVEQLYAYLNGQQIKYVPKVAEDVLRLALQLNDDERRRLAKLLIDNIGLN